MKKIYPTTFSRYLQTFLTWTLDNGFFKEIDGCTMREPILVTISDIYVIKMEENVVKPRKPKNSIHVL